MEKALVGRQPIYDDKMSLFAYELLYRHSDVEQFASAQGERETAQVLMNTVLDIGLNRVVGSHLAFVNMTRKFLMSEYCDALPRDRFVLEILRDDIPDTALLDAVTRLSEQGFRVALDDFGWGHEYRPLLELADIVKIDIRAFNRPELTDLRDSLREFRVKLLAEKVETPEEYELAKSLGFDYFQGFFFCRPQTLSETKTPVNRVATLRLLARLQDPAVEIAEIEKMTSQDVTISFNLLRFVNSAGSGVTRKVDSIRHAVALVGLHRIRTWASLIVFASMDDKPRELMVTAITRARMCELLAIKASWPDTDQFFTVGLFSVLDALLDRPMKEALELLPLADEVQDALLEHIGTLGWALKCVQAYERADWDQVFCGNLSQDAIRDAYLEAVEWTRQTIEGLGL